MKLFSYLAYITLFEVMVIGGCGYAVFVREHSGWWFLLAILISGSAYPPERWSSLWDQSLAEKYLNKKNSEVEQ